MDPDESGGAVGQEGVEEGETLIRIDYVREKNLSSIKGKSVLVSARKEENVLGVSWMFPRYRIEQDRLRKTDRSEIHI